MTIDSTVIAPRSSDSAVEAAFPTVPELLALRAQQHPDRVAVSFPAAAVTYRELAEASERAAAHLVALGVGRSDVVGILADGGISTVVAILATAHIGSVSLPINNRFRAGELRYVLDNGDVRVLLVGERFADEIAAALPSLAGARPPMRLPEAPVLRRVVDIAQLGTGPVADVPAAEAESDDDFVMIYTSGTTSRPRGCLHSHAGYVQQGKEIAEGLRLTGEDRFWTPLPFFHVGGYDVLLASMWAGATMVHPGVFAPDVALTQLAISGAP